MEFIIGLLSLVIINWFLYVCPIFQANEALEILEKKQG